MPFQIPVNLLSSFGDSVRSNNRFTLIGSELIGTLENENNMKLEEKDLIKKFSFREKKIRDRVK